jgi:hypothetical protein
LKKNPAKAGFFLGAARTPAKRAAGHKEHKNKDRAQRRVGRKERKKEYGGVRRKTYRQKI